MHAKSRETNVSALRVAMLRKVARRIAGKAEIYLPGAPALLDSYMEKFEKLFDVLGKPFSAQELERLREIVKNKLETGWRASPFSLLRFTYKADPSLQIPLQYVVNSHVVTMEQHYDTWIEQREPPLFGKFPDAKVMKTAAALGTASRAPVLDVGAGTGRNAVPLALLGHPTDAIEPVAAFGDLIRKAAEEQHTTVNVISKSVLDPALELKQGYYKLIVMAEVIASHFTEVDQIRAALTTLGNALAPGGMLVLSAFLTLDGYKPDPMAKQVSRLVWSSIFSLNDFELAARGLPISLISDESAFEYEKKHLPPEGWPPTGWYATWACGCDLFALPLGHAPIDLRWLTYRRQGDRRRSTAQSRQDGQGRAKNRRRARQTSLSVVRLAMLYNVGRRIASKGVISFPCIPTLVEQHLIKLATLFDVLGKPFSDAEMRHLAEIVDRKVRESWEKSPFGEFSVEYETKPPPHPGIAYTVQTRIITKDEQYADWIAHMDRPLFGKLADAKVLDVAASLGPAAEVPVLDVGAGNGRNALPLGRLGHPVDAIEPVALLAGELRKAARDENTPVNVIESSVLDSALALKKSQYKLVVMAQVIASHFRDIDEVQRTIPVLCDALAPGGILVLNTFLAMEGYKPDVTAQQVSQMVWSRIFTRGELAFIGQRFPLDLLTDESVFEYEKSHLRAAGWPPTAWFEAWAQGLDLFDLPAGKAPIDLRWLAYRKR